MPKHQIKVNKAHIINGFYAPIANNYAYLSESCRFVFMKEDGSGIVAHSRLELHIRMKPIL